KEAVSRKRYKAGELSLDVHGMREGLAQKGLTYVGQAPKDWGNAAASSTFVYEDGSTVIIDCHGHYTTTPGAHQGFRDAQLARLADPSLPEPVPSDVSDDAVRESIENNQLKLLRERGGDMVLFSPKASGMEHHVRDPAPSRVWARACNALIHRVVQLFPQRFAGVCQFPQPPDGPLHDSV